MSYGQCEVICNVCILNRLFQDYNYKKQDPAAYTKSFIQINYDFTLQKINSINDWSKIKKTGVHPELKRNGITSKETNTTHKWQWGKLTFTSAIWAADMLGLEL